MGNPAAAIRVANTIATFKWVVIGLLVLAMFVMPAVFIFAAIEGNDLEPIVVLLVIVAALVGGLLGSSVVWVLFGWFEQTLRMLAMVAGNTGHAGQQPAQQPFYR